MKHILLVISALALASCTTNSAPPPLSADTPRDTMVRIAKRMQSCWFAAKDPTFRPFKLANEVNSLSGRPRVLIVPRRDPGGLPKLVVQAEKVSGRTKVSTFGPLLGGKDGSRVNASINRWAAGDTTCNA